MAALEVKGVTFSYDNVNPVLKDINLKLNDGELVCLLGVSGGGKTTLFNIISGLYKPQEGKILLNGEDITGKTGKISYMLQKDMLLPYRTVLDSMRQRAALLRTYLFSAEVALLDEPFSALDTLTKSEMHEWYLNVMSNIKLSTIFITHDVDEAILLSDRIYLLGNKTGTISDEIIINEPKPRSKDFNLTEQFLN